MMPAAEADEALTRAINLATAIADGHTDSAQRARQYIVDVRETASQVLTSPISYLSDIDGGLGALIQHEQMQGGSKNGLQERSSRIATFKMLRQGVQNEIARLKAPPPIQTGV